MWEHFEAVQMRNKTINIRDFSSDVAREMLEIRDRIIRLELGFNFLVVATIKQCYIFRSHIFDFLGIQLATIYNNSSRN